MKEDLGDSSRATRDASASLPEPASGLGHSVTPTIARGLHDLPVAPIETYHGAFKQQSEALAFQREREEEGYALKAISVGSVINLTYERQRTRDALGFTDDKLCRADEIAMLERCAEFTRSGNWCGGFSYPSCPQVLLARGWATTEGKITDAGAAALAQTMEARRVETSEAQAPSRSDDSVTATADAPTPISSSSTQGEG